MIIDFDRNQVSNLAGRYFATSSNLESLRQKSDTALKAAYNEGHRDFKYDEIDQIVSVKNQQLEHFSTVLFNYGNHLNNLVKAIYDYLNFYNNDNVLENHAKLDSAVLRSTLVEAESFTSYCYSLLEEKEERYVFQNNIVSEKVAHIHSELEIAERSVQNARDNVRYCQEKLQNCEEDIWYETVSRQKADGTTYYEEITHYPDCSYEIGELSDANDILENEIAYCEPIRRRYDRAVNLQEQLHEAKSEYDVVEDSFLTFLGAIENAKQDLNSIIRCLYKFETTELVFGNTNDPLFVRGYLNSNENKLVSPTSDSNDPDKIKKQTRLGHHHEYEKDGKKYIQITTTNPEIYQRYVDNYESWQKKFEDKLAKNNGQLNSELSAEKDLLNNMGRQIIRPKLEYEKDDTGNFILDDLGQKKTYTTVGKIHLFEENLENLSMVDAMLKDRFQSELSTLKSKIANKIEFEEQYQDKFQLNSIEIGGKEVLLHEPTQIFINNNGFGSEPGTCRLSTIKLPEEFRGLGIGKQIVKQIEVLAKTKGQNKIKGFAENENSKAFFLKCGYTFKLNSYNFEKEL